MAGQGGPAGGGESEGDGEGGGRGSDREGDGEGEGDDHSLSFQLNEIGRPPAATAATDAAGAGKDKDRDREGASHEPVLVSFADLKKHLGGGKQQSQQDHAQQGSL
jgi:hypothetical protein